MALSVKAAIFSQNRPEMARRYREQALDLSVNMDARLLTERIRRDLGIEKMT